MIRVAIIVGSTRPARKGATVARWVLDEATAKAGVATGVEYELVDIKDYDLPLLDEPVPAAMGEYSRPHTKRWAAKIASFDGFVLVTPEYNHGTSAALKNALDFLFREWTNKAVGFVGYGGNGGARAVEQLRQIVSNLEMADVRAQVSLTLQDDFERFEIFQPRAHQRKAVGDMLDQIIAWSAALRPLRSNR